MTEREEENEIKVTDRRKFNLDGSVREGVEIEPEKPKNTEMPKSGLLPEIEESEIITSPNAEISTASDEISDEPEMDEDELEAEDYPGADDPASFVNFLSTLATNAVAALGAMPHPVTGQRSVDLETGKFWIDILVMLREKTKGNLHQKEAQLLEGLLGDLQMQYVQMMRATEEKLKAQAAQKFSANDILGKK